jgi:hypothetical protein
MMSANKHLEFLVANQPLPPTKLLSQNQLDSYDEARRYFLSNLDNRCIPLFLGSFGEGDGCGLYQLIPDVLALHDHGVVVPHLKNALSSQSDSIKYWSAQVAARIRCADLLPELFTMFTHENPDLRTSAYIAAGRIGGDVALSHLLNAKQHEDDELALEILSDMTNPV